MSLRLPRTWHVHFHKPPGLRKGDGNLNFGLTIQNNNWDKPHAIDNILHNIDSLISNMLLLSVEFRVLYGWQRHASLTGGIFQWNLNLTILLMALMAQIKLCFFSRFFKFYCKALVWMNLKKTQCASIKDKSTVNNNPEFPGFVPGFLKRIQYGTLMSIPQYIILEFPDNSVNEGI